MPISRSRLAYPFLALAAVLAATLFPAGSEPDVATACLTCADPAIADIIVNVILFLPLGAGLALQGWPARRCVLVAAALSAGVEYAQLFVPHRDSSFADFVSNTAGAFMGLALVRTAALWLVPPPRRAAVLALGAAGAAAVTFVVSGLLLSPSLPTADYLGPWTPNVAGLEWYRGRVLDATLGGLPIPSRALATSAQAGGQLLADPGTSIPVRAAAGSRTAALGHVLRIADAEGQEILLLGPDRQDQDIVFRFQTRAAHLKLDQPDLRLSGGMREVAPGDTVEASVRGRRGRYCITVNGRGACGLGFTAGWGWALLYYPEALPSWAKTLLNLGWMGGLTLLPGFWARGRGIALVAAGIAATGLIVAPLVNPILPTSPAEWVAGAAGFALGALAQRALRQHLSAGPASR